MKRENILIILGVFSGVIILVSNLLATKIFSFFGIPMDAGVIIYPLIYLVNDLTLMVSEDEKNKAPEVVIWSSFLMNVFIAGIFYLAILLPEYPGWENQEAFRTIFGMTIRTTLGSLFAFLASSLVNLILFRMIGEKMSQKLVYNELLKKSFVSSAVAKIFDVFVFEVIAFFGILPIHDFFIQAGFAYFVGIVLEVPLSMLTCFIYKKLKFSS